MRIFISSARRGLEKERDALPGLISALRHTPVRFEDFSAQTTPSREACLAALASADVCLFLLGPNYGHTFPETGQSATHDEWAAAKEAGMPRLVYRKDGIRFEPAQHDFVRTVEAYATGVFRDSFHTTEELMTKVTAKVRELEAGTSPLAFARLSTAPPLLWVFDDSDGRNGGMGSALLELHIMPIDFAGYSVREMQQVGGSLVGRIRNTGVIGHEVALTPTRHSSHVSISIPATGRSRAWNVPEPGALAEVRLYKTGQIALRATLPRDSLGEILDAQDLPRQIADMLRFAGALDIVHDCRIAVAAGVSRSAMLSVDTFRPGQPRHTAQPKTTPAPLRTDPDESVTLAALATGAEEVASTLARELLSQYPSSG